MYAKRIRVSNYGPIDRLDITFPYQPVAKSGFLGFMFFSNAGVEMA